MQRKTCTKCKKEYSKTIEYFPPDKRCKDGLQSQCRICCRQVIQKWGQSDKGKEYHKKYNQKYQKKYYNTINGYLRHVYSHLKSRCNNPKCKDYKRYGGRGICNKFKSSNEFVDYVNNVLKIDPRGLTIDRINNDGNYEPDNIRFVTSKENNNNRRDNV